jgi:hypothetical protein
MPVVSRGVNETSSKPKRIFNQLVYAREIAKNDNDATTLENIFQTYKDDYEVCFNLANNSACSDEIRLELVKHARTEIKYSVACFSEYVEDERVLKKLAMDDYEIRKAVAENTKSNSILKQLFRNNPHHPEIGKICIERLTDMEIVEKLFFSEHSKYELSEYIDCLLKNQNISNRIILLISKDYVDKLSDEQITLIIKHIERYRSFLKEMLNYCKI